MGEAAGYRFAVLSALMRVLHPVSFLAVSVALSVGGCSKGSSKALPASLPEVKLPASDVEAGRALGKAAATEKDPAKLAATLVAFLDRLHVPVVSRKGDKLLAQGPIGPTVQTPWLWEPAIDGVARATTLGDARPFAHVLGAFVPKLEAKKVHRLDFRSLVKNLAASAAHQPVPVFGPIAAAIDEDLSQRQEIRSQPPLDPVATLLLGLMLVAERASDEAALAAVGAPAPKAAPTAGRPPGFPNIPGLPPGFVPPHMPPRSTVHAMDPGGGGSSWATACKWISAATGGSAGLTTGLSGLSGLQKASSAVGGIPGLPTEITDFLDGIGKELSGAASIAGSVTDGIAGMGITAFFDADGKVEPTKVAYGDGPATYTVVATSANPLSADELDTVVSCLEAADPGGAALIEPLRKVPPHGRVPNIPVVWGKTDQYDPKHGKFTVDGSPIPAGKTDSNGEAKAQFQVKPKKGDGKAKRIKRYTIFAEVFPFPLGASQVNAAANELFCREVPLALEIEVPLDDWTVTVDWSLRVQPPGPMYFADDGKATVTFKLDPNDLTFHQKSTGTHTYSMPDQVMPMGMVDCQAPVGPQPVEIDVDGKVLDYETMKAEMHVKITPMAATEAMTIKCTPHVAGAKASTRTAQARYGSISSDTKLEDFTMTLDDGETKEIPIDKQGGPMHVYGPAVVSLAATDGS
jgi:hypothetical protein